MSKVSIPVIRGTGKGHRQFEEFEIPDEPLTVTIPRVQHEALMAAAKWCKTVRKEYAIMLAGDLLIEADEALAALRAAGILEGADRQPIVASHTVLLTRTKEFLDNTPAYAQPYLMTELYDALRALLAHPERGDSKAAEQASAPRAIYDHERGEY